MTLRRPVAVLALLLAISCDSPTGPIPEGGTLPLDHILSGEFAGDTVSYRFDVTAGDGYLIAFEVTQGDAFVRARDAGGTVRANLFATAPTTLEGSSTLFEAVTGGSYTLEIGAYTDTARVRFRVRVSRIGGGPEQAGAIITPGDTVTEALGSALDFDVFTLQAPPGSDVVVVPEAAGPAASGLLLRVLDAAHIDQEMTWFGAPPATVTTGRITIPASGAARLRVASNAIAPRYVGAYRLRAYAIDRAPESRGAALPSGAIVADEALRPSGDVDELTFTATAGEQINLFFRAAPVFRVELGRQNDALRTLFNDPADTALFTQSTGRLTLDTAGTYTVRVRGPEAVADTGAYRLYLYRVNPAPEHVPAALTPGDTLSGERIELPGDVDEFTFTAVAGRGYRVSLQATDGRANTRLQAEVVDPSATVLKTVYSAGSDTALLGQSSGLITAAAGGTYRVRVATAAFDPFARSSAGPYRLLVYAIDPAPETAAATLALNDSVQTEALDVPGDIDEFTITVPAATAANLLLDATAAGIAARVIDGSGLEVAVAEYHSVGTGVSGRFSLQPGTYTLRVASMEFGDVALVTGGYGLRLYGFSLRPETAADTFAIGDTVQGEIIAPAGDADQFVFHASRGDRLTFMLQGLGPASPRGVSVSLTGPTITSSILWLSAPVPAATLSGQQVPRLEIGVTGWYTLTVEGGGSWGASAREANAYRFAVVRFSGPPEHGPGAIVIGDSLAEQIDSLGDVDDFTLTGAPGQTFAAVFGTSAPCCAYPRLGLLTTAGDTLAELVGQFTRVSDPIAIPADGRVRIEILERTYGFGYQFTGPYRFQIVAVDTAPEGRPAAIAVGDTVLEAITTLGDRDVFVLSAAAGQVLRIYPCLLADPQPANTGLSFHVINPANGTVLAGGGATVIAAACMSEQTFTVPPGGSVLVRVQASQSYSYGVGAAPYRFVVRP